MKSTTIALCFFLAVVVIALGVTGCTATAPPVAKQPKEEITVTSCAGSLESITPPPRLTWKDSKDVIALFFLANSYESASDEVLRKLSYPMLAKDALADLQQLKTDADNLWQKAVSVYEEILRLKPDFFLVKKQLAFGYLKRSNIDKAFDYMKKASTTWPYDYEVEYTLGRYYQILENYFLADENLRRAFEVAANNSDIDTQNYAELLTNLSEVNENLGNFNQAALYLIQLDETLQPDPDKNEYRLHTYPAKKPSNIYMQIGKFYLKDASYEKAIRFIEKTLDYDVKNSGAYLLLSQTYYKTGKTSQSQTCAKQYVTSNPSDEEGLDNLDTVFENDLAAEIAFLQEFASHHRDIPVLQYHLAHLYEKNNETYKATDLYTFLVDGRTQYSPAYIKLAEHYSSTGDFKNALILIARVLTFDDMNLNAYKVISNILDDVSNEDVPDLFSHFKNISAESASIGELYISGLLYEKNDDLDNAITAFEEVLKKDINFFIAYVDLTQLFLRQKRYEKALTVTRSALDIGFQSPVMYKLLATIYTRLNKPLDAIRAQRRAVQLSGNAIEMRISLAVMYEEFDEFDKAELILERLLKEFPDNAEIYNTLGYLYADRNVHLERAVELIEKALEMEPKNGHFLDSLGWAYFRQGRNEEALDLLKKAAQLEEHPVIYEHIGDVYKALGNNAFALQYWKKALQENDRLEQKEIDEIEGKIKTIESNE